MDPEESLFIEEVRKRPSLWNVKEKDYYNTIRSERDWAEVGDKLGITKNSAKTKWKKLKELYEEGKKNGCHEECLERMDFLNNKRKTNTWRNPKVVPNSKAVSQKSYPTPGKVKQRLTTESAATTTSKEEDEDMEFFRSLLPYMKRLPAVKRLTLRSELQASLLRELEAAGGGKLLMECAQLVLGLPPTPDRPKESSGGAPVGGDDSTTPTLFALSEPGGLLGIPQLPRPPSIVAPPPPVRKLSDSQPEKYYDAQNT